MKRYSLIGVDGNAFAIMGYVNRAIKESGRALGRNHVLTQSNIDNYVTLATSGDYNELLALSVQMIDDINDSLEKAGKITTKKISPEMAAALLAEMGLEVE